MKKLLKEYSFTTDMEYYEMIIESGINGQREQAREQFNAMPKGYRKDFIGVYLIYDKHILSNFDKMMFINEL